MHALSMDIPSHTRYIMEQYIPLIGCSVEQPTDGTTQQPTDPTVQWDVRKRVTKRGSSGDWWQVVELWQAVELVWQCGLFVWTCLVAMKCPACVFDCWQICCIFPVRNSLFFLVVVIIDKVRLKRL